MNIEEIKQNKNYILNLAKENNAERIRVFGSVARSEEGINSDIDFLVKFSDKASYFDLVRLNRELEGFLNCKVDVVSENAVKS